MSRHIEAADLPEDIARIAEAQVAAGHFASVEEVVRAGVEAIGRRAQRQQQKVEALRAALEEGERSGITEDSSLEGVLAEARRSSHRGRR
jgi:antitoxin ParD1/3/4